MKTKLTFFENNVKIKEIFEYFETKKQANEDFKETKKYLCTSKDWQITEIYEGYISAKYKDKTTSLQLIVIND